MIRAQVAAAAAAVVHHHLLLLLGVIQVVQTLKVRRHQHPNNQQIKRKC